MPVYKRENLLSVESNNPNLITNEAKIEIAGRPQQLLKFRNLLHNLVIRDLKVKYKNSALGVIWSLLNPLLLMVVFSLVFTFAFGQDIRQYPVFFLSGLLPWRFFTNSLVSGTVSITTNSALVKKVYFPRELLPISALISNLVNFGIALIILVVFLYGSGLSLTVHALWVFPILVAQMIFTLGLALLLGSINVFYRDVLMILDTVLLAWFFLTPIMYSLDYFGDSVILLGMSFDPAQFIRWVNPMASIIDGYRTVLWGVSESQGPTSMSLLYFGRTMVTSILVFVLGYAVFLRVEGLFGEKL